MKKTEFERQGGGKVLPSERARIRANAARHRSRENSKPIYAENEIRQSGDEQIYSSASAATCFQLAKERNSSFVIEDLESNTSGTASQESQQNPVNGTKNNAQILLSCTDRVTSCETSATSPGMQHGVHLRALGDIGAYISQEKAGIQDEVHRGLRADAGAFIARQLCSSCPRYMCRANFF